MLNFCKNFSGRAPIFLFTGFFQTGGCTVHRPLTDHEANLFVHFDAAAPPVTFSADIFEVSVTESAAAGSVLFTVALATNPPPGSVVYSLLNFTEVFQVDSVTGAVRLKRQFDHETCRSYTVPVSMRTHSLLPPLLTATATYLVTVENENNNPMAFERAFDTALVMESNRLSRDTVTVWAVDPDDAAAPVYYTIEPENRLFRVDASRGAMSNLNALSWETARQYSLTVRAMDPTVPFLYSEATVVVVVEGRTLCHVAHPDRLFSRSRRMRLPVWKIIGYKIF